MTDFKNEYLNYKEIYLKLKYKNQTGGNIQSKSLIPNWIKDCTLIDPSLDTINTFLDKTIIGKSDEPIRVFNVWVSDGEDLGLGGGGESLVYLAVKGNQVPGYIGGEIEETGELKPGQTLVISTTTDHPYPENSDLHDYSGSSIEIFDGEPDTFDESLFPSFPEGQITKMQYHKVTYEEALELLEDTDGIVQVQQPPPSSQAPPPSPLLEPVKEPLTNYNIQQAVKDYFKAETYLDTKERFGELSLWDVSQVTIMTQLFFNISIFEDISNWDVSNVEDMSYMFYNSILDENINLNKWDDKIKKVLDFEAMFMYSTFSNGGQDFKWNINDDVNVESMFYKSTIDENKIKIFGLSQDKFEKMFIL